MQIKHFAKANRRDIILFPTYYFRIKKDGELIVKDNQLLCIQDEEEVSVVPRLLCYCRKIPACLLSNICIKLEIVNGAQDMIEGVIPHLQDQS